MRLVGAQLERPPHAGAGHERRTLHVRVGYIGIRLRPRGPDEPAAGLGIDCLLHAPWDSWQQIRVSRPEQGVTDTRHEIAHAVLLSYGGVREQSRSKCATMNIRIRRKAVVVTGHARPISWSWPLLHNQRQLTKRLYRFITNVHMTGEIPRPERVGPPVERLFNVDALNDDELVVIYRSIKAAADVAAEEGIEKAELGDNLCDRLALDVSDLAARDPERVKGLVNRCIMSNIRADQEFAVTTSAHSCIMTMNSPAIRWSLFIVIGR